MEFGHLLAGLVVITRSICGIVLHSDADLATEILLLKQRVAQLEARPVPQGTGSTYIRWGRKTCNTNGTDLVYTGYMAGHHYNEPSGGSEFLCLPHDVTWPQPGHPYSLTARIYGTEYEMHAGLTGNIYNQDVPCCLCKTRRATAVMFPGRTNCFPGWTLEYHGYLTAGQRTSSLTSYACTDSSPEALDGGAVDNNEAVLHNVEAKCGSLPCPPYIDGRVLACAVCSI